MDSENTITTFSSKVKHALIIVTWLVFLIGIYLPFIVYTNNRAYFTEYFSEIILPVTLLSIPLILIFTFLLGLVPKKLFIYLISLLTVFGFFLWGMGDFFAVSYGSLNGLELTFSQHELRGKIEIMLMTILCVIAIKYPQKIINKSPYIVLLVLFAQLMMVVIGTVNESPDKVKNNGVIDDELYKVSSSKNIIIIVLDTFGSEYFQQILNDEPGLEKELGGFVSYTDAISNYPVTKASVPSFLMGELIPENIEYNKYLKEYVSQAGLPKLFEEQGYLASVLSTSYTWFSDLYSKRFYYELPQTEGYVSNNYWQLLDYGIFRMAPHYLKYGVYNDGVWLISNYVQSGNLYSNEKPWKSSIVMDEIAEKLNVNDDTPRFKFLHFTIPHPKLIFNADCQLLTSFEYSSENMLKQSKCAIKKLLKIFKKMKSLGIYDSSLIVVMSDHGARMFNSKSQNKLPDEYELKSSGILLMIKGIGAQSTFMQIDNPVSLLAVNKLLLDWEKHNGDIDWLNETRRYFSSYRNEMVVKDNELANGIIYEVEKGYSDPENWKMHGVTLRGCEKIEIPTHIIDEENENEAVCYKYGLSMYLKKIQGVRLTGSDGIISWKTKNIQDSNNSDWFILIEIDSNKKLFSKILVNGIQTTVAPVLFKNGYNRFEFPLNKHQIEDYTTVHIKLMGSESESDLKYHLKPSTKVFLKELMIKKR